MSALRPLHELAASGMQPVGRIVWLGLGFQPPKRNAITIDPDHLPTDADCAALAALDVVLSFHGHATRYGTLKRLCGAIYQARPRRLQLVDLDYKRVAFLKLGGA